MILARVVGTAVASRKSDRVGGAVYLIVEECRPDGRPYGAGGKPGGGKTGGAKPGARIVAVDPLGAGPGELVIVSQGSSARQTGMTKNTAVDAVIAGIVDLVETETGTAYRK